MPFQYMCPQGHLLEGHEAQMGQQTQCPICYTMMVVPVVPQQGAPMPAQGGMYPGTGAPGMPTPGYSGYPANPGYAPQGGMSAAGGWQPAPGMPIPGYGHDPAVMGFPGHGPAPGPYLGQPMPVEPSFPRVGVMPGFAPPAIGPPPESHFPAVNEPEPPRETIPALQAEPEKPRIVRILCPNNHELHTPMDMVGQDAMCPQCNVQFRLRYEDSVEYKEEQKNAQRLREEKFGQVALNWAIVAAVIVVLGIIIMVVLSSI